MQVIEIRGDFATGFTPVTLQEGKKHGDCTYDDDRHPIAHDPTSDLRLHPDSFYEGFDIERPFDLPPNALDEAVRRKSIESDVPDVSNAMKRLNDLRLEWDSLNRAERDLNEIEAYTQVWRAQIGQRLADMKR
jgi:hypothetical protein